ncbi:hypothetical protein Goarm_009469, partial [Gossypium armourianum]|nr:hypothetical protein [Gossypium armourianum]
MLLEMGQEVSNWASCYICFSKAALFISAIVAYVADERLGRFKVVGYTTAAFITGLVILCFEYKDSRIFYVALLLVTLRKGGRSPTLKAFLKDQFGRNQNSQVAEAEYQNRERAEARHQFWWCTAWFLGVLTLTIVSIPSCLSLKKAILISSIITGAASLFFVQGIRSWKVEVRRLKLIKEYGIPKSEVEKIPMSILWLTPQYLLLGIMSGLVEAGMEGCFYNLVPGSMKVYELLFKEIVMGMGKFLSILTIFAFRGWFGDESSTSHLDRYFLMLAMISLGSLAFFSVAAYACYWKIAPEEDVVGSNMEMEEGLAQATPASSSGEPLGNPSSAEQLITQEFSTKRVLKGASSPPYFPLHGDSMATSGWNDVGRKSLRNRSFGNRVQKGG